MPIATIKICARLLCTRSLATCAYVNPFTVHQYNPPPPWNHFPLLFLSFSLESLHTLHVILSFCCTDFFLSLFLVSWCVGIVYQIFRVLCYPALRCRPLLRSGCIQPSPQRSCSEDVRQTEVSSAHAACWNVTNHNK